MIRMVLDNPNTRYASFFNHVEEKNKGVGITGDMVNDVLKEYNASYHVQDVGNLFESRYEEYIEFANEEDYTMFLLRWS